MNLLYKFNTGRKERQLDFEKLASALINQLITLICKKLAKKLLDIILQLFIVECVLCTPVINITSYLFSSHVGCFFFMSLHRLHSRIKIFMQNCNFQV